MSGESETLMKLRAWLSKTSEDYIVETPQDIRQVIHQGSCWSAQKLIRWPRERDCDTSNSWDADEGRQAVLLIN